MRKDLVETVSGLIGVFQNLGLDFGSNREADDDLIGDAYEFLMKNFQLKPSAENLRSAIDNESSFKQQYQEFSNAIEG